MGLMKVKAAHGSDRVYGKLQSKRLDADAPSCSHRSLRLGALLPLGSVQGGHVLGGGDQMHEADGGLQQADDPAEAQQPVEPVWNRNTAGQRLGPGRLAARGV